MTSEYLEYMDNFFNVFFSIFFHVPREKESQIGK